MKKEIKKKDKKEKSEGKHKEKNDSKKKDKQDKKEKDERKHKKEKSKQKKENEKTKQQSSIENSDFYDRRKLVNDVVFNVVFYYSLFSEHTRSWHPQTENRNQRRY